MKIYQSPLPLLSYLFIAASYLLIQIVVLWFFLPRSSFLRNNLIMLPLGVLLLWWVHYISVTSMLRVDAEGFDWQQGRLHLRSSWSNVSHLGSQNDGYATTYGLFLKTAMPTKLAPKGILPKYLIDPKTLDYVPLTGIVPLPIRASSIDENALRQTPFGQDLMRRAPQVFQHPQSSNT